MKKVFTFYLILFSFLVSQDALQLFVKTNFTTKDYFTKTIDIDQTAEDLEDSIEDESENSVDAIYLSKQEYQLLHASLKPKLNSIQKDFAFCNVYLEKSTPPPQV
ncbi:MAG: hypothetical protein RJA76_1527 [Bacteroidota bacterium]|jgi:hypothetical protein